MISKKLSQKYFIEDSILLYFIIVIFYYLFNFRLYLLENYYADLSINRYIDK
jgi:hypothetical protein